MEQHYYNRICPQIGEIVTCRLISFDQTGQLTVQLLDYADTPFKQQIIPFSQLGITVKRQSMMKEKIEEIGKQFGCQVYSTDKYTNRVDLSYANVGDVKQEENFKQYGQHKKVRTFIISVINKLQIEDAYQKLLYDQESDQYPEVYYFYRDIVDKKQVKEFVEGLDIEEEKKDQLIKIIQEQFQLKSHTYRFNFVIRSFYSVQGINVIIKAVQTTLQKYPQVKFVIDAPPQYYATIESSDSSVVNILNNFAKDLSTLLKNYGASCRFERVDKSKQSE